MSLSLEPAQKLVFESKSLLAWMLRLVACDGCDAIGLGNAVCEQKKKMRMETSGT